MYPVDFLQVFEESHQDAPNLSNFCDLKDEGGFRTTCFTFCRTCPAAVRSSNMKSFKAPGFLYFVQMASKIEL